MIKILLTVFLIVLIPVYWKKYGPQNFLWLSDIGLFLTFFALWLHSPLLISMAVIGVLPFEIVWIVDYFYFLIRGRRLLGVSDYMFDPSLTLFIRSLSLFHIVMPFIWIYFLLNWGYDVKAIWYQTGLFWLALVLTYFFTNPAENINWVFISKVYHWRIRAYLWLILQCVGIPLIVYLPMHLWMQHL